MNDKYINIPKKYLEEHKVLDITRLGEYVGYFYWDTENITLHVQTDNELYRRILKDILHKEEFFNPISESIEHSNALENFELFLLKAVPELTKYGYGYKIINGRFNRIYTYIVDWEFPDGHSDGELGKNCFYNELHNELTYYNGDRERGFKVVKIIKDIKGEFQFIDSEERKVTFYLATIEDYKKYRNGFFCNAPELKTTEDVQGWCMRSF